MAKCKPVTLDQLVGGQTYLRTVVANNGQMWLESFICRGVPFVAPSDNLCDSIFEEGLAIRGYRCESSRLARDLTLFATDAGLDPDSPESYSRVFRFTSKNHELLSDLVTCEDLVGYLTLLGLSDSKILTEILVMEALNNRGCPGGNGFDDEDWECDSDSEDDWDESLDDLFDDLADDMGIDRLQHRCS